MKNKYTKRQIQESIAYWQKILDNLNEARQFDLADKNSATNAILKHINSGEIAAFVDQKPKPTKDELVEFIANIFKEEGLDTPWTRQFLIKMKMYTHGFDDAVQYLFNAYLKGHNLGMDQGKHFRMNEADYSFNKYFIQMFTCYPDGQIDDDINDGNELKYYYPEIGIDKFFNTKSDAIRALKLASRKLSAILNADVDVDDISHSNPFTNDDYHVLAVLRQGDEYESKVIACFIDGKLSPDTSISSQLSDALDESKEDNKAPTKEQLLAKKDKAKDEASKVTTPAAAKKFLDKHSKEIDAVSNKLKGDAKKNFGKIVKFLEKYSDDKKLDEGSNDVLLKIIFGCAGVISFMCSLNTFAWFILSPIVGPILLETVKRLSSLK